VTVQEYRSQTAIIHTLRGAALWAAAWTTFSAVMLTMWWPHESGLDTLRFIAVLVA
jgi:hypothetical protein